MKEILKISDFDIVGIIKLKDVEGIEEYVTQIGNEEPQKGKTEYLSRSKEYYNVKSLTELSTTREQLKTKLTRILSKRNFVILENMLNCSAKVYFKKFEEYILSYRSEEVKKELEQAKKCLLEDTSNILKILDNRGLITVSPSLILPIGRENSARRFIEMDNKAMLYIFCKSLKLSEEKFEVLTPGYGSLYIGPFLNQMYGYEFTNLLKSKYIQETCGRTDILDIKKLVSNDSFFRSNNKILLIDDNIGTGQTMNEIKESLKAEGMKKYFSGAIQYNWRNYYRVSSGEKKEIERFDVNDFEVLTPLNYAGHKLYAHAIDILHSSGEEYIRYLNSKSYRKTEYSDIEGSALRGIISAKRTGLTLSKKYNFVDDKEANEEELNAALNYQDNANRKLKPEAIKMIENIIQNINSELDKQMYKTTVLENSEK